MTEIRYDLKVCKDCRRLRKRIPMGTFDTINKKYHDDDGYTWNGHRCGICHRIKMKEHQREKSKVKDVETPSSN